MDSLKLLLWKVALLSCAEDVLEITKKLLASLFRQSNLLSLENCHRGVYLKWIFLLAQKLYRHSHHDCLTNFPRIADTVQVIERFRIVVLAVGFFFADIFIE